MESEVRGFLVVRQATAPAPRWPRVVGYEALSRFPADTGMTTEQWYQRAAAAGAEAELEL
jgi:hypothetical protein